MPSIDLEQRLLSALATADGRLKATSRRLAATRRILNALLDGWHEDSLRTAVDDSMAMFEGLWKIEDGEGDTAIAEKKIQTGLICLSRLASGIGQRHLSKAIKGTTVTQFEFNADRTRAKESREQSLAFDEHLLFLSKQARPCGLVLDACESNN